MLGLTCCWSGAGRGCDWRRVGPAQAQQRRHAAPPLRSAAPAAVAVSGPLPFVLGAGHKLVRLVDHHALEERREELVSLRLPAANRARSRAGATCLLVQLEGVAKGVQAFWLLGVCVPEGLRGRFEEVLVVAHLGYWHAVKLVWKSEQISINGGCFYVVNDLPKPTKTQWKRLPGFGHGPCLL